MIEELKRFIKEEDSVGFKKKFEQSTVNAHHRELLYEITFRKQALDICQYLEGRVNLNKEKKINIFLKALIDGTPIKDFKYIKELDDMLLAQNFSNCATKIAKSQNDEFLIKFMESKPITAFMNFKRILFSGFKYERIDFIDYVTKQELDKNLVFYGALCAINFKKKEAFSTLLLNAMKYNPNILEEVKNIKNEYIILMRGKHSAEQKEEFEAFISETIIETFALHLNEELSKKKSLESSVVKSKKIKI